MADQKPPDPQLPAFVGMGASGRSDISEKGTSAMPRISSTATLHERTVKTAAKLPAVKPDPIVWAAALQLAHGDASVLHVESRTVVWVGKPIVRTVRAPRKRGARK